MITRFKLDACYDRSVEVYPFLAEKCSANGGAPYHKIVENRAFFFFMILVAYLGRPWDFFSSGSSFVFLQISFLGECLLSSQIE